MPTATRHTRKPGAASDHAREPTWEIARFYPMQGEWTEDDYFALENNIGNWMVELDDGYLEFLPMPDMFHQDVVDYIFSALKAYLLDHQFGRAYFAPLPIRLWPGQIREPDIAVFESHRIKDKRKAPNGADFVVEVVSPGEEARERDLQTKRRQYAKAKIREYWIVDPETRTITVLSLSGRRYKVAGVYGLGESAVSRLLKGFKISVSDMFAAGDAK